LPTPESSQASYKPKEEFGVGEDFKKLIMESDDEDDMAPLFKDS
jgi:hypothetical protein